MKKLLVFLSGLLLWGCDSATENNSYSDFTTHDFNKNWQFARGIDTTVTDDLFNEDGEVEWEDITLPHTANIEPLVISNQQWQGTAFYRKYFEIAPEDSNKYVAVKFGAAMHEADIWLNGEKLAKHKGGYLPFVIDITNEISVDEQNVLLVKLNNEDNPTIPPGKPVENLDFNYFSGLYRSTYLLIDDKLHISDPIAADRIAAGGVRVNYSDISEESANINVQTDVSNFYSDQQEASIKATLQDESGVVVAEQQTDPKIVPADSNTLFQQSLQVSTPNLWSPDDPYLYTFTVELSRGNQLIDKKQQHIGIRTIDFNENNQFLLNGEPLQLRGTNRHQSYPYIGYALSDNAQYRDAYKIKEAGFNFIRTAHYPPSPAFLDAADELGLLFMNAIPGWQFFGDEEFQNLAKRDIRQMIRRDRNHPSIIIWEASLNESEMDKPFMDRANEIVHEELPFEDTYSSGWIDYTYDIFIPARQHAEPPVYWNDYSKDKPLFIAEYGDWEYYAQNAGFNQDEFEDLQEEERNSRQLRRDGQRRLTQQALNFQEAHNSNLQGPAFGDANWVMYDYNRGYADNLEASGIRDIFRIPKFANYFYQSQAGPNLDSEAEFGRPMIYIANYWSDPDYKTVKVYSNAEEVELFHNGKSLARHAPDSGRVSTNLNHPPFTFELDEFEAGTLHAVGYFDGEKVVEDSRMTPGDANKIQLDVDISGKEFEAGQKDVIFVYASVVDEDGNCIPDAENRITFSVEGSAQLIGDNPINAEAGIATILLRAGDTPGTVTVSATNEALKEATKQVEIK